MATMQPTLEAEIAEVQAKLNSMDVFDEVGEAEFGRLQIQLESLKSRRGTRVVPPSPPGMRLTRTGNHAMTSEHSALARHYVQLHGLEGQKLDDGGFKSLGEFLQVFGSGRYDPRIQDMRVAASTTLSSSGGVMVPEKFLAEMLHPPGEAELILPRASSYSMQEGMLHVATLDNLTNASGVMYGGFVAQWVAEGEEFDETTPVTTSITLTRKKLGLFTVASNELVSDSQYEQHLIPALQAAIQDFRDDAFFNGDGLGKPKGIVNDVAMITVAKETNQPADTIVAPNLDKMYARLHPRLVRNARWYVNPTCIPQLLALSRPIGTAGVPIPVLNESNGSFSMYGLPVDLTSKLPVLGDAGDIVLADVSQYAIGMGRGIVIDRSEHLRFHKDQVAWRAVWRGDGQGRWRTAFQPRNSAPTLSWCVKLAERA